MPGEAKIPALRPGATARRLGVAVETLRSWERRYGLGPKEHRPGQHRRFTQQDVALLERFCLLVGEGVPPAEAARSAQKALSHAGTDPGPQSQSQSQSQSGSGLYTSPQNHLRPATDAAIEVDQPIRDDPNPEQSLGRGGAPAARGLTRCAMRLDPAGMLALLETALARDGVVSTWQHLFEPALRAVGRKWTETEGRYVEVEHLLSWCATVALHRVRPAPQASDTGGLPPRSTLLACAPGEWHSLPMEALTAALHERGAPVRMLGPAVPEPALRRAIERTAPARVVLWSQARRTADTALLARLASAGRCEVSPAGPGWIGHAPPRVSVLRSLAEAVEACAPVSGAGKI